MTAFTPLAYKTFAANSFKATLSRTTPVANNLYMFFGRSNNWTAEPTPDTPVGTISENKTLRDNLQAIKKIPASNVAFIVPRYDWVVNTVYAKYDIADAALFTKNFYVTTSDYNVYKCINNNGNGLSSVAPYGTSTATIQTGDGYEWKFMYNLSTFMVDTFLTPDWLPVPTAEQKTPLQITIENAAVQTSTSPVGGHGKNAYFELGGKTLMVVQSFNGSESSVLSTTTSFRQIGLVVDPTLISTALVANGSVYTVNQGGSDIDKNSGFILYYENREVISRSSNQSETFKLILSF